MLRWTSDKRFRDRGPLRGTPRGIPTLIATALLLAALLLPGSALPKTKPPVSDLVVHLILFAGWLAFTGFDTGWLKRHPLRLAAVTVVFAFGTETLQLLVEGRHFDFLDIAFNVIGAAVGYAGSLAYLWLVPSDGRRRG
ncbi:MAG: VanZ family protein [Spirochaetaceae bacterium]|nr:MAG: VanZ family protein [Spirochaetaceae bacterium]